jgi:hypothetical protein
VTTFNSVRLAGLPLNDAAAVALGIYLPFDENGDGVVDMLDGRPVYVQRDIRTVRPALNTMETGVRVGKFYLYYRYALNGWVVDTTVGSAQALLFLSGGQSMAHELDSLRTWARASGSAFVLDRRLQLFSVASPAPTSDLLRPTARAELADGSPAARSVARGARLAADGGSLCPQGKYRDEPSTLCADCPRGRFGDSNALRSALDCSECPAGRFLDWAGARTVLDCRNCTAGRFASSLGSTECGGACALGKHSIVGGATDRVGCVKCPRGYHSDQCDRKDKSRQARRLRERELRESIRRNRQDSGRAQMAAADCSWEEEEEEEEGEEGHLLSDDGFS